MFHGELLAITTRPRKRADVESHQELEAGAGRGLTGDHRCADDAQPSQQVTLIEAEALQAAEADYGLVLSHADSRRNLLTRGVPLNHLVGRRFRVGEVTLRGVELCEPCGHLAGLTGREVVEPLRHRGGLRAAIEDGGLLRVGDAIEPIDEQSDE